MVTSIDKYAKMMTEHFGDAQCLVVQVPFQLVQVPFPYIPVGFGRQVHSPSRPYRNRHQTNIESYQHSLHRWK